MGGLFSRKSVVNEEVSIKPNQSIITQRNSSNYPTVHNSQQSWISIRPIPQDQFQFSRHTRSSVLQQFNKNSFPTSEVARQIFREDLITYHELNPTDMEYRDVKRKITNRYFRVESIERIDVPFLKKSYMFKKYQKEGPLEELELFHGTSNENINSICRNNFNWRFRGKQVGHRFGQGVSFSCNAMYAANYSKDEENKVMFIAKVMVGKRCIGRKLMKLPDDGCDTSTKQDDNIVLVKYEDNEFFPLYLIRFHIAPGYVPMNQRE